MATKNDITNDSIMSRTTTDKFRDGYAAIFNKDKCPICGKTGIHTCTPKEVK